MATLYFFILHRKTFKYLHSDCPKATLILTSADIVCLGKTNLVLAGNELTDVKEELEVNLRENYESVISCLQ